MVFRCGACRSGVPMRPLPLSLAESLFRGGQQVGSIAWWCRNDWRLYGTQAAHDVELEPQPTLALALGLARRERWEPSPPRPLTVQAPRAQHRRACQRLPQQPMPMACLSRETPQRAARPCHALGQQCLEQRVCGVDFDSCTEQCIRRNHARRRIGSTVFVFGFPLNSRACGRKRARVFFLCFFLLFSAWADKFESR